MTPGTYLRLRRRAAGLTRHDVACIVADTSAQVARVENSLTALEQDRYHPTGLIARALQKAFPFDVSVYLQLIDRHFGNDDLPLPQLCRVCACSFNDPCVDPVSGPCAWASPDLCSACKEKAETHRMAVADSELARRLGAGQLFNAFARVGGGFLVGIGPVTDFYPAFETNNDTAANRIVDALRSAYGQPDCIVPVTFDQEAAL